MPFIYKDVDTLDKEPPTATQDGQWRLRRSHQALCAWVKGVPTSAWRAGGNVLELGDKVARGTAIATFVNGRYQNKPHGNHAAVVVRVMKSGIWVVDQWKERDGISARLIRIPPPRQQYNQDGSFKRPSDNALAFYVIER